MKIVVLAGGFSPERDISLSSGCLIANALLRRGHQVALVDVFRGITAPEDAAFKTGTAVEYSYKIPETEPDLEALRAELEALKTVRDGLQAQLNRLKKLDGGITHRDHSLWHLALVFIKAVVF